MILTYKDKKKEKNCKKVDKMERGKIKDKV